MSERSLTYGLGVTRAHPLPPDERRRAIVAAAVPLLLDQGPSVTTRQIAEAAGIAEGTLFRAFPSKADLLAQAIREAVAPGVLLDAIAAAPAGASLDAHAAHLVAVVREHAARSRRLMAAAHRLAGEPSPTADHATAETHDHHRESGERIVAALAASLEPYAAELTETPLACAGVLVALAMGSLFAPDPTTPDAIARVLLHGVAVPDHERP